MTGASSGIGSALARELASRGHSLIVVARRQDRLDSLALALKHRYGVRVEVRPCDLADRAARAALRDELAELNVSILCNNAGFATFGSFAALPAQREHEELELNVVAVQDLTHAVVPGMCARGEGAILITGSTAGFQPMPRSATYCASKAFANTFSEALHGELKHRGITCTLLAPGPVTSEFSQVANIGHIERSIPGVWLSSERVARDAVRGMERGKRLVVPGLIATIAACSGRHAPRAILLPIIHRVLGGVSRAA
ncbi:NADH(P)-binding family protein [Burkholderia thailandensis]|uniref:NADP-dependent 3-hydroxy acid dehydrogenase YdfG n=1 Tax=Burkholderia thailandensis TaxID=57975 RepID=A0AAW9CK05_BURTH|nr:SDR family oxidoreductase [Burkholderia thailandensis]AHI66923.1 short chain dehydrogenase family protein [Burkholderia thailandensis H0587]AVR28742.1 SDR family NAD(P)-dependent oxidoreductase [Burkholderia thailandensis]MDD1479710.1 SDR family oxidoreductase [Burkholderia thailandensis]MDD1484992.1 SDR family oxidoreductase [Burkholderia thailandensis]MDD1491702.1 SDR family oxidoreductase [Burkholderia thailandensis]